MAEAFPVAVAPFVVSDILKTAVALVVARGVRAAGLGDASHRPISVSRAG
jgi:biotin transporter BioY